MSKSTHNKKGYFALRAGRALRARPYLGRYKYMRIAVSFTLLTLLSSCSSQASSCESKLGAFKTSNAYVFGRAEKLNFQRAFFAEFESKDTEVEYLGECLHKVKSLVMANDIDKPQRVMAYTVLMKRNPKTGNWKLSELEVRDNEQNILLEEKYDL